MTVIPLSIATPHGLAVPSRARSRALVAAWIAGIAGTARSVLGALILVAVVALGVLVPAASATGREPVGQIGIVNSVLHGKGVVGVIRDAYVRHREHAGTSAAETHREARCWRRAYRLSLDPSTCTAAGASTPTGRSLM